MYLSRALLAGASFVAAVLAQSPTSAAPLPSGAPIAFTTLPGSVVTAGQPVQLAWSGGDGVSPVTITLKQGSQDALATVAIITGDATGNSYTWTPLTSLPDASNYALQISQGVDDVNYSGEFALVGGATTTSTTMSSTTTTTSIATAIIIAGPSGNTTIINPTIFSTTLAGTAASSGGTGIPMSRNTTFASQTLTATATVTATTGTGGVIAGPSTVTTAGSSASASASTTGSGARKVEGSSLALVLVAVVGIWMLN